MTAHDGVARMPADLDERSEKIYRLRVVNRLSFREIGQRLEPPLSMQRVAQIFDAIKDRLPKVDLEAVRREALKMYEDIQRRAYELAELEGAPITRGKDGEILYEPGRDGEPAAVVRDYSGRVAALKLALDADKERRKLLGADAASKVETSGTVNYTLAGVDPDDLR